MAQTDRIWRLSKRLLAVCLLSARFEGEVLFNHRDDLCCKSWTSRRKLLAQVGPLCAGLSPFPAASILQSPGVVPFPTYPFHGYHQDGRPDGSRVDAVAPTVVVDPHGDGEDAKHDEGRSLRLIKLCQGCKAPSTGSVSSPTPFLGCSPKALLGSVPPAPEDPQHCIQVWFALPMPHSWGN